jgi:peptidylprolyl isomerase
MKFIQCSCAGTIRGGRFGGLVVRAVVLLAAFAASSTAQQPARPPLAGSDIDDIARVLMLEDRRQMDDTALARILRSAHPEVRRRAALAIGRIADARGRSLLVAARNDRDPGVAAAVILSTGQLTDTSAVAWLAPLLAAPQTPQPVAREAARTLGKIRTPESHAALAGFLSSPRVTATAAPVVGEALLSIGRFTTRGDLSPIVRWTTSPDTAIRWRAAWALMRLRDPAAVSHLLRLSEDPSPEVRFWSVRGLTPSLADSAGIDRQRTSARLRAAVEDGDRRVRTEALRALGAYDDDASFAVVLAALDSPDSWISVSAGEALGRFQSRAAVIVPRLIAAAAPTRPLALRITVLTPLAALSPPAGRELASALAADSSATARQAAMQALRRLDAARADSGAPGTAGRGRGAQGGAGAAQGGRGAGGAPGAQGAPQPRRGADTTWTIADYRRIAERWVVTDYNGAAKPRAIWETPRGAVELELYPGDAPLAMEYFARVVGSGEIVDTEFGRVVPNFVAQQRTITNAVTLRDEVSVRGLTRGNLSWASAGLDTGRPGYTLGSTPQPHNEGGFTALGRVVNGMDVVDRLELGDRIIAARMVR